MEFDEKLPERLFATYRYPVERLNIYSKVEYLSVVHRALKGTCEFDRIRESWFGQLFEFQARRCPIACKFIHGLLARQVVTKKKYELWTVFGGQPMRFSISEYAYITGLNCGQFPEGYDIDAKPNFDEGAPRYWDKLLGDIKEPTMKELAERLEKDRDMPEWRKFGIALILIVDGVLIARNHNCKATPKFVEMLRDVDGFLGFPWGRESFMRTIADMKPGRKGAAVRTDTVEAYRQTLLQQTKKLAGFPLALQLVALRAIPALVEKMPEGGDNRTLLDSDFGTRDRFTILTVKEFRAIENDPQVVVQPTISLQDEEFEDWTDWEDEFKDKKVEYLERLIEEGHKFSTASWPGGAKYFVKYVHGLSKKVGVRINEGERSSVSISKGKAKKRKQMEEGASSSEAFNLKQSLEDGQAKIVELKAWFDQELGKIRKEFGDEVAMLKEKISRLKQRRRYNISGCSKQLFKRKNRSGIYGQQRSKMISKNHCPAEPSDVCRPVVSNISVEKNHKCYGLEAHPELAAKLGDLLKSPYEENAKRADELANRLMKEAKARKLVGKHAEGKKVGDSVDLKVNTKRGQEKNDGDDQGCGSPSTLEVNAYGEGGQFFGVSNDVIVGSHGGKVVKAGENLLVSEMVDNTICRHMFV